MEAAPREERDGLKELKSSITEFLRSGESSLAVREFISSVSENDLKLVTYLKGRKYSPNHAWETLLRYAEVRFNEYPEVFSEALPDGFLPLFKTGVMGFLKTRDDLGRRIVYFNGGKWEPSEISLEQMTSAATHFIDRLMLDEDVINNGVIIVQNCTGMGMKHFKAYSLRGMLQQINIFCYAYPVKVKACYYLNVPFYALYLHKLVKPFLSKKLKERFIVSTTDRQFEVLHENISPKLLPKLLGGVCDNDEVTDWDLLYNL
ncbi:Retinaldehyde-binding protein 1 [Orchesella cincta]|uniref:Retinaldehyde-binding protein 1 n=1 Tax=Orchesella cincta TaxID=48709 RepID=A0A1D2M1Q7_ORCCI|nr:Retinaldehyde-binding protein 1 [Orchesella cincta]